MGSSEEITVAIVEDTDHIGKFLESLVSATPGFRLAGRYASAEEAARCMIDPAISVAIIDIHLPGNSGIELIKSMKPRLAKTQFLVFTIFEEPDLIFQALSAGATGYLIKSTPPAKILEAIADIAAGGSPMSGNIARTIISRFQPGPNRFLEMLTSRERETLELMAKGFRYKEIADKLFISMDTVRTHVRHIYNKLEVQSKTEALNKAFPR